MTAAELAYTDPARVLDTRSASAAPLYGRTVTGYGPKIPTRHEIRYHALNGTARWHRVYVMCYGNAGAAYIVTGGVDVFIDATTEARLSS